MLSYNNPSLVLSNSTEPLTGTVSWKCPSNIAIVKYWGKHGMQLPKNASVSFTLEKAFTNTEIKYSPKDNSENSLRFYFEGEEKPSFLPKIHHFIDRIKNTFPFLRELDLEIHSSNSFPHSAGIASSASSMGALALCFCSLEKEIFGKEETPDAFLKKASYIARLGSGSACRSIFPYASVWGKHEDVEGSDDYFGIAFEENLHEVFKSFRDDILIISKSEKEVSSTLGHQLMDTNIFAKRRFQQASDNLSLLLPILEKGDVEEFGEIAEAEALSLHALMMTSNPSFILMTPNTLKAISRIRRFRKEQKLPVYFTLDAGPNIHLLYPEEIQDRVGEFKKEQLRSLCEGGQILDDRVGLGPKKNEEK